MNYRPKNILVFCDGTGQDGLVTEEAPIDPKANNFTNVLRLSRAITKTFANKANGTKRSQIVYYQSGVGVAMGFKGGSIPSDLVKKGFGTAVASKIRDAYNFIAQNYEEGDQICIFGFSRGAYTARKISGLIDRLGLLDPKDMGKFFPYWRQLNDPSLGSPPKAERPVPIKCVGVWDTVGSVQDGLTAKLDALTLNDARLPSNVEIALHAVAFHENRKRFLCTLYDEVSEGQTLKQVWFPGAHSDVGGGYAACELADISLAWMVGEIKSFVGVDEDFVLESMSQNAEKPDWGESRPVDAYKELGRGENQIQIHQSLLKSPVNLSDMATLPQLKQQLPGWDAEKNTVPLTDFEIHAQKYWKQVSREGGPEFETLEDLESMM